MTDALTRRLLLRPPVAAAALWATTLRRFKSERGCIVGRDWPAVENRVAFLVLPE